MSNYRRYYQPGGYYFFTLATYRRRKLFCFTQHVQHLKAAIIQVKKKHPFHLNAIVILPDHLHCLWKLPKNDTDFSTRWRLIKRYFSMTICTSINHRKEKQVWQRRFWEHHIRNENDWQKHMDYIHYNPVKHGLVQTPADWPHSSFYYWVNKKMYEKDWGSKEPIIFTGMDNTE